MAKTIDYWKQRALEREASYQIGSDETISAMQKVYDRAFDNIRKQLKAAERQFLKKGGDKASDAQAYLHRMRIMEELQEKVSEECKRLENIERTITEKRYSDVMQQGYYRTMFDIQKGVGVAFDFAKLPKHAIQETMLAGWKGRNFSKSIWKNTQKLSDMSQEIIKAGFLSGASINTMTAQLMTEMAEELEQLMSEMPGELGALWDKGKRVSERLIRSETNYFANQGELYSYAEAGIDKYQYLATLDERTSNFCQELDGKVELVSEAVVGVNYPPMHAWCRSTTVAWFDDQTLEGIERRARDPVTGKTYLVPADMYFDEWYDKKVRGNTEAEAVFKAVENKSGDKKQFEKYKELLGDNVPKTFADFQKMKYNDVKGWGTLKDYKLAVSYGNLTSLVSIADYTKAIGEFDTKLLNLKTSNGIEVKSYSKHFIDRYFGSIEQRRSGVEIDDIIAALMNPIRVDPVVDNANGKSQRLFGKNAIVTINPKTGNLIQTNPNKKGR